MPANPYKNHRFPAEIISHAVWLYFRLCLSYRDVEERPAMLPSDAPEPDLSSQEAIPPPASAPTPTSPAPAPQEKPPDPWEWA